MHTGVEGEALQSFLPTTKGGDEEGDEENTSVFDSGGPMALQVKVDIQQSIAGERPLEDNEGVIKLAANKSAIRWTKHIGVKHHLVRDACDARKVRVVYARTED